MTYNEKLIEKYADFDKIIKMYYQLQTSEGLANIDGIVSPLKIDNRQSCAPTDNQGQENSCAAFSIANICESILWKKTGKIVNLDAHQIYAKAKILDGSKNSDGTYLECAIKAAFELGGFDSSNIDIGFLYNDGSIKCCEMFKFLLHKYDFIHCGFMIQSGWYNCSHLNYVINCSGANLGGHAVVCPYYDEVGVGILNSWGPDWGAKGFGMLKWADFSKYLMYACYIKNSFEGI